MKYLFAIGGVKASGAEKRMAMTAIGLRSRGYDVDLVLRESLKKDFNSRGIYFPGLTLHIIRDSFFGKRNKLFYLFNLLFFNLTSVFKFEKYCCHIAIFNPVLFPIIYFFSQRFYFEITSPDIAKSKALKYSLIFYKKMYCLCVSESVYNLVNDKYPQKALLIKLRTLPYVEKELSSNTDNNKLKENRVIFAHRLIERKNPILALQLFSKLANDYPDWSFEIYGDGPLSSDVSFLINSVKFNNINYFGRTNSLNEILERSKIFVSLIEPDNYPSQSILEAMKLGNALFLSDTGYSKEKFITNNGIVSSLNLQSLVLNFKYLLDNFENYNLGVSLAKDMYSYDRYLDDCELLYEH